MTEHKSSKRKSRKAEVKACVCRLEQLEHEMEDVKNALFKIGEMFRSAVEDETVDVKKGALLDVLQFLKRCGQDLEKPKISRKQGVRRKVVINRLVPKSVVTEKDNFGRSKPRKKHTEMLTDANTPMISVFRELPTISGDPNCLAEPITDVPNSQAVTDVPDHPVLSDDPNSPAMSDGPDNSTAPEGPDLPDMSDFTISPEVPEPPAVSEAPIKKAPAFVSLLKRQADKPVTIISPTGEAVSVAVKMNDLLPSRIEVTDGAANLDEFKEDNATIKPDPDQVEPTNVTDNTDEMSVSPGQDETNKKPHQWFSCCECGYSTKYKFNYTRHVQSHTLPVERETPLLKICEYCGAGFKSEHGFRLHIKNKHELKFKVICPVCGKGFNQTRAYRSHYFQHKKNDFKCKICSKTFPKKTSLTVHESKCNFECRKCRITFMNKRAYRDHVNGKHKKEPMYACKFCDKRFPWRSSRSYHQKTDHKEETS